MNQDKFENHIKIALSQQEVPVNFEELTSAIYSKMHRDKLSKRIIIAALLCLFCLLSTGFIYYISISKKPKSKIVLLDDVSMSDHGPTSKFPFDANFTVENSELRNRDFEARLSNMTREKDRNPTSYNIAKSDYNEADHSHVSKGSNNLIENVKNFSDSYVNKQIVLAQDVDKEVPSEGESILTTPVLRMLDLLPISTFYLSETSQPLISGRINCPSFERRSGYSFYFIPEIGVFKPFRKLEFLGAEPSAVYNLRKNNETSLEGLQAAVYGRVAHRNSGIYFQSGIYYSRQSERMNLEYNYTKLDTVQGIISITQSPMGDTLTVIYGDIVREINVQGQSMVHHYFQTFDIPLAIGYERAIGDKDFNFGIEGGIMLNLSLISSGRVLTSDREFTDVNELNAFRSSLGVSYYAGANVSKVVGTGRLYLAARLRHIPTSFTDPNFNIKQSYQHIGLHLGYIIPLNSSKPRVL